MGALSCGSGVFLETEQESNTLNPRRVVSGEKGVETRIAQCLMELLVSPEQKLPSSVPAALGVLGHIVVLPAVWLFQSHRGYILSL